MIDLNDLVWQFAVIQLTRTLPNLHFMAALQCLGPTSVPWDLSWLLVLMSLAHTCRLLTASFIAPNPVTELDKRQWENQEPGWDGILKGWARSCRYSEGGAGVSLELRGDTSRFLLSLLGDGVKQPTDTHGLCSDWEQVPCRLHPNWIEHFSGLLWGFSRAEFWGDGRAAQEPHPSGMFCLAGPPTWVARATQPGCGDGQSLQVSKALVPDIFGHWFNFYFQKYPWSKQWAVHKRSCVFFSPPSILSMSN